MNKYELVLIAAREARRMNELAKLMGSEIKVRTTELAWDRLQEGKIQFTYDIERYEAEVAEAAKAADDASPELDAESLDAIRRNIQLWDWRDEAPAAVASKVLGLPADSRHARVTGSSASRQEPARWWGPATTRPNSLMSFDINCSTAASGSPWP